MGKLSKNTTTILIIIACIGLMLGVKWYIDTNREDPNAGALDRVKGPETATLKIVEFIDFQCPACAAGAQYLKQVMQRQPGLIQLTVKYFPLNGHRHAFLSAQYAECSARQGKFWPYHDLLVARQKQWENLNDAKPAFDLFAKELELNLTKLDSCLADESVREILQSEKDEGKALGVQSTPTYFVNGEITVGLKSLSVALAEHLKPSTNDSK